MLSYLVFIQKAPADKISINIHYQLMEDLNIGLEYIEYDEQQRLSEDYLEYGFGTESADIYNLNFSYTGDGLFEDLLIRFGVDNLTNERHVRAPASEARDPAELGRNYKLTLNYIF